MVSTKNLPSTPSMLLRGKRHQAMLVTRGALNRLGKVIEFVDMEKDDITIDISKYILT